MVHDRTAAAPRPAGGSRKGPTRVASTGRDDEYRYTPSPGPWTLPASILAGCLVLALVSSAFLALAVLPLVWLILVHRATRRELRRSVRESAETAERVEGVRALVSLLGDVIDAADAPILSTDSAGIIAQSNRAAKEILGSGRELIGEHFDSLITQDEILELERLAREGESNHARLDLPVGGAIRIFDVSVDPIPSTGGTVCTFTDITELMQSVELKADFAANASHELRTPISAIKGAVETIQGPAADDGAMRIRLIGIIASNAERLEHMVNDLLDLSKLESGTAPASPVPLDVNQFINGVCAPFGPVCARRSLEIVTKIDEEIRVIESDPVLLELIVRNLIENATKFAFDGTSIRVSIERASVSVDPAAPPPGGLTHDSGITLKVRDKGAGIPIAQQPRIFERFYQVDEARTGSNTRRGTGLGLAIVKHAARTLGGNARVESIQGQGTTMIVDLPRCVPEWQDAPDPPEPAGIHDEPGGTGSGEPQDGPGGAD